LALASTTSAPKSSAPQAVPEPKAKGDKPARSQHRSVKKSNGNQCGTDGETLDMFGGDKAGAKHQTMANSKQRLTGAVWE
jgi:hypothetical protein